MRARLAFPFVGAGVANLNARLYAAVRLLKNWLNFEGLARFQLWCPEFVPCPYMPLVGYLFSRRWPSDRRAETTTVSDGQSIQKHRAPT